MIQEARDEVIDIFDADPTLEKHQSLAQCLEQLDKQRQDFLTKS
jgi:hypothetical protein